MRQLEPADQTRLAEMETVIAAGMQTFVEVGRALEVIRDERLYRQTHKTFESYLDDRWSISRRHGYRLIEASVVAALVSPMGHTPNERQARELVSLLDEPDEAKEAWEEAVTISNGKPTAAITAEAVKRRTMTEDDRAQALALHAEGRTLKKIAETIGYSTTAVSKVIRAAASDKDRLPRRRQAATPQTLALAKLHRDIRGWDALGPDEEYIPAPELARRLRVLDDVLTFLTKKRANYYAMTARKDD